MLKIIMTMIINFHNSYFNDHHKSVMLHSHNDDHDESMILQSRTINRRALAGIIAGSVIPNPSHDDDGQNGESIQNENASKVHFLAAYETTKKDLFITPHF